MKKFLSLLLTAALLLGLCGAAAADEDLAFQKFDHVVEVHIGMAVEPTDVTLEDGDTADNNYYTRYLLDNDNIKVVGDWTAASGDDFNQKVALTIASDSLPDAMVVSDRTYFTAAAEDDMLYDLTEVFDQYASEQVKAIHATTAGKAAELVTYGGKMLALPNISVAADGVLVQGLAHRGNGEASGSEDAGADLGAQVLACRPHPGQGLQLTLLFEKILLHIA